MAGSEWRVEREVVRCGFLVAQSRIGIHERLAVKAHAVVLHIQNHELVPTLLKRLLDGLKQPFLVLSRHFESVHDKFDRVVLVSVELHAEGNLAQFPVDSHVQVTFLSQVLKEVFVVTFSVLDHGRQEVDFVPVIAVQNQLQNLVDGVLDHGLARNVTVGIGGAGIKQSQIVVNLGGRSNGRARVLVGGLLAYGDDRI